MLLCKLLCPWNPNCWEKTSVGQNQTLGHLKYKSLPCKCSHPFPEESVLSTAWGLWGQGFYTSTWRGTYSHALWPHGVMVKKQNKKTTPFHASDIKFGWNWIKQEKELHGSILRGPQEDRRIPSPTLQGLDVALSLGSQSFSGKLLLPAWWPSCSSPGGSTGQPQRKAATSPEVLGEASWVSGCHITVRKEVVRIKSERDQPWKFPVQTGPVWSHRQSLI